ncbi:MAG: histidine phosphatase family protein [Flavobacteriales bacterium]|nr:histidine phosphatase family protein [Flavobacteriales bacterium]
MKTLFINRHAKSSWDHPGMSDYDRPLNGRGLSDCKRMSLRFAQSGPQVDAIVTSSAKRALTTAQAFAAALPGVPVFQTRDIYLASVRELLKVINGLDDTYQSVMIFGHNPGFSDLVDYLSGYAWDMPTCARAQITFDVNSWAYVSRDSGTLVETDYPKKHAE